MRFNKINLIIIIFCIFTVSCIKDKGNYDITSPNKVEITKVDDPIPMEIGKNLKIIPEITFSQGENDQFNYEWYRVSDIYPYIIIGEVLSTDRNIDIPLSGELNNVGEYKLILKVINKKTEIVTFEEFKIRVLNKMSVGFVALCEKPNNNFDIDMVALFNDTLTLYNNVFSLFESELPRNGIPRKIVCYDDVTAPSPLDLNDKRVKHSIWILTDQYTNRIKPEDFSFNETYNISYVSTIPSNIFPKGSDIIAENMSSMSSGRSYMYMNKNWFFFNTSGGPYFYAYPINKMQGDTTKTYFNSADRIAINQGGAVIFDNTNKKFVKHQAMMGDLQNPENIYCSRALIDNPGDIYEFNSANYELVELKNRNGSSGYSIVKNTATGKYELLQFGMMAMSSFDITKTAHGVFTESLDNVKFFAANPTLPYLYYATEDKVYKVHTATMTTTDITSQVVPAGHKISIMEHRFVFPSGLLINNKLILGTYNPNGNVGENGQLAFYSAEDGTGNLILAKHPAKPTANGYQIDMKWSGLGKIVSLDYKQK